MFSQKSKMIYVLDTNFFIISRKYYVRVFPTFWDNLDQAVTDVKITSIKQIKEEIDKYRGKKDYVEMWIKNNPHVFPDPRVEDLENLKNMLATKIASNYDFSKNKNYADPFIIAKAMSLKDANEESCVVSDEKYANKDNSGNSQGPPKIPDICKYFGIPCISVEQFMVDMNWKF